MATPTLSQINYYVKLHALRDSGQKPPFDLPPMTDEEASKPGSPLRFRCKDAAYGDKPGEPRDPRLLKDVIAHEIKMDNCLELMPPREWFNPFDAKALRRFRSKDLSVEILATSLRLPGTGVPKGWYHAAAHTRPQADSIADLMRSIFVSAHFEGRKLLCKVRRSRGRILRVQPCPLTDGKEPRRPDQLTSCVACDLELGNIEYALLVHETYFLTDLEWDCGMSSPVLAVTCIDGLALEADVAAGVLTQDDVHTIIDVIANTSVLTGAPTPSYCKYSCRAIDTGPGTDGDGTQGFFPSILAYAEIFKPTKRQAGVMARVKKALAAAGRPPELATRVLINSVIHWHPNVLSDLASRSPPLTYILAQTHSAATAMRILRQVHAFAGARKDVWALRIANHTLS